MLGNILSTGEQVLILVVLLAVGFLCGKIRIFNDQSISHLSAFALKIVGPCAIVESFCRQFDSAMLRAMGIVALLAFAAHALYAAFAYVCIRGGKEPTRRVLRYGTVFANCGYMGLPLQQVLFGADGVFYGATWVGVYNLVAWSFGLVFMSGDRRQISFKKLLLNPVKKVIAERKAKADSQIADAEKLRAEAEAMKAEYEQNLQNARTEANQIVAAAQKTATARSEEIVGEARAQAAALKQKAEADIAQERKKAVNEAKDEIGGMAMEIASKVVEREIKEADHKDLIDEFIKNVGEAS
mgnify:FL=1